MEEDNDDGLACCSKLEKDAATKLLERTLLAECLCLLRFGTCGFNRWEPPWKGEGNGQGEEEERNGDGGH